MRVGSRIGAAMVVLAAAGFFLAACETVIDPATGATRVTVTLPGTTAHGERLDEQWQRCIAFNSESVCRRRLAGGPQRAPFAPEYTSEER